MCPIVKRSPICLLAAAVFTAACGSSTPLAPDAVSRTSPVLAASASPASVVTGDGVRTAYFPRIDPPGISCPSDAPQIRVGSLGMRMDVDFSEVNGASEYEIEIRNNSGAVTAQLMIPAPASRAEWYGAPGPYLVRVRTHNCGGLGRWSESIYHSLHPVVIPTEQCNQTPSFTVQQETFTFWPGGELMNADVVIRFDHAGPWYVELVRGDDDAATDTEAERAIGGVSLVNTSVTQSCGQSAIGSVHEANHAWPYWWYRIYRGGVLQYVSQRFSL